MLLTAAWLSRAEEVEEEGREGRAAAKAAGTISCSQPVTAKPQPRMLMLSQAAQGILCLEISQDNSGGFMQTPEKAGIQIWSAAKTTEFWKGAN